MSLKDIVKYKKKDLARLIKKAPRNERNEIMNVCRNCLVYSLEYNEDIRTIIKQSYEAYLNLLSENQKEACKIAYDIGLSFGPGEVDYAKEQLINKWLNKKLRSKNGTFKRTS